MNSTTVTNGAGLLHALLLDGQGGARALTWFEVQQWQPQQGVLWLHWDYTQPATAHWLAAQSALPPQAAAALTAEDSRPRTTAIGDGLLMGLRGVNMNPQADPDELVSLRLYFTTTRLITTRERPLKATEEVFAALKQGQGPTGIMACVVAISRALIAPMEPILDHFEVQIDEYEDHLLASTHQDPLDINALSQLRQQVISLRRHLSPQREALAQLVREPLSQQDPHHQQWLHEVMDQLSRQVEAFDEVRDRAAVVQEELIRRSSEALNARMYVLSIITAIFLPLSFMTGLLGVNVGGIPWANQDNGFWIVLGLMLGAVLLQLLLLKQKRWL